MEPTLAELWSRYFATRAVADRNAVAERYAAMVGAMARDYSRRWRAREMSQRCIDRNDLYNEGFIGLIDAIGKYDPSRGVAFVTYAKTRIHGAMVDGIRDMDWVPRLARSRKEESAEFSSLARVVARTGGGDALRVGDILAAPDNGAAAEIERRDWFLAVGLELTVRERLMVAMLYRGGATMLETATALGVSESLVSQLNKQLKRRLRTRVETLVMSEA